MNGFVIVLDIFELTLNARKLDLAICSTKMTKKLSRNLSLFCFHHQKFLFFSTLLQVKGGMVPCDYNLHSEACDYGG